jgi:hypothetical protein
MYSIIEVNGGIGKSIMATAIIAGIKKKHSERKLLVVTAYPMVFLNNPNVYRVFSHGSCPYFYDEYVKDKDVLFFCDEPYRSNSYMKKEKHLIESWGDILNVECEVDPKIYLNGLEETTILNKFKREKPVLVFQPFGGAPNQKNNYSWNRDIPIRQAQNLATFLSNKYHVIQPVVERQIKLEGCEHVTLSLRDLFVLIKHANVVVGIDSFVQHARKALGGDSMVFWVTNSPKVFGYENNINILPTQPFKETNVNIDGYLDRYDFTGSRTFDYPFEDDMVFDMKWIIDQHFN